MMRFFFPFLMLSVLTLSSCKFMVDEHRTTKNDRDHNLSENSSEPFNCDNQVYLVVEEMPKLIGGLGALQRNLKYPPEARSAGIEGRVIVQFVVTENGKVACSKVIRGIGGGCDKAAIEAISKVKFSPGIEKGEPVPVLYSLPIVFSR